MAKKTKTSPGKTSNRGAKASPKLEKLAQSVVELLPATKVLVISGYADEPSMWQKSRSLGFTFLAKPFSPETLAQLVRSVLDSDQRAIAAATI